MRKEILATSSFGELSIATRLVFSMCVASVGLALGGAGTTTGSRVTGAATAPLFFCKFDFCSLTFWKFEL